ncbi:MAG: PAS domain-containing protein, partial [Terrimicrobiaceae bacterium]
MGRRIREFDWTRHPLGPLAGWPQSLKIVVRIMLTSRYAMWLGWGAEFYFFCNDSYAPTLGIKRDAALGVSARKVWEEIWSDIGPRTESVVWTVEATWDESLLLFLERSGYAEETCHTFSYSPVPNDDNSIGGMLCVVTEETERAIGGRRLASITEEELFRAVKTRLSRMLLNSRCATGGRADDYVTKLFHARKLIAKVTGTLTLAKVRAERKQADEALRQSEAQLRPIADTAPVLIVHCDRDHRYKFANAPYAARFGLRREQVIGRRIAEVVGEAAYESFRGHVERALAGEAVEFEMSIPCDGFGVHYMHGAYAPERNAEGKVAGLVAAIVDITDRKRVEMLLLEQHELLEQIAAGRPLEECLAALCTA